MQHMHLAVPLCLLRQLCGENFPVPLAPSGDSEGVAANQTLRGGTEGMGSTCFNPHHSSLTDCLTLAFVFVGGAVYNLETENPQQFQVPTILTCGSSPTSHLRLFPVCSLQPEMAPEMQMGIRVSTPV